MKLWAKVFVTVLILVNIVEAISLTICLYQSRSEMISYEQKSSIAQQEKVIDKIINKINASKKESEQILLTSDTLFSEIDNLLPYIKDDFNDVLICDYKYQKSLGNIEFANDYMFLAEEAKIQDNHIVYVDYKDSKHLMLCVSCFTVDREDLVLVTSHDVSALYTGWDHQIKTLNIINFSASLVVALLVLILIFVSLFPLTYINDGLKKITDGQYDFRIKECGSYEFKILSRNINYLTENVVTNIDRIQSIADGRKTFIDNFAHEMKTPLTSIIGFSNLLKIRKNIPDDKRVQYARIIENESERLRNLSTKLLDLATAEQIKLDFTEVSASELFNSIRTSMIHSLQKKHINLFIDCDDTVIHVDKELFKSLLYNLIENAIKASKPNDIISLKCISNERQTIISVADNGIGMDEHEIRKVTEPFYMVDKSRSRKENGVGLGLALCTEIVKQHNAIMHIGSKIGKGTTVYIFLPK